MGKWSVNKKETPQKGFPGQPQGDNKHSMALAVDEDVELLNSFNPEEINVISSTSEERLERSDAALPIVD